jgi:ABC-type multidrug transport system ATPase subunit
LWALGPNGAGKTTAVKVLATLLAFEQGRASVAGFDVTRQARQVRENIGLVGQYAVVDEILNRPTESGPVRATLPSLRPPGSAACG